MPYEFSIIDGVLHTARRLVVYGPAGVGKSTAFAHLAKEETLYLDVEGSTKNLDVRRILIRDFDQFIDTLTYLSENYGTHNVKHLIIDGLDALENMMITKLCREAKAVSIETLNGGYGKGYVFAAEKLLWVLSILDKYFVDNGIDVILIGHSTIQHIDEPDDLSGKGYDRYTLQMANAKKAVPIVCEWADAILFFTFEINVIEVGGKLKASGNTRVIYTEHTAAHEAKNRYGFPAKMPLNSESIHVIVNEGRGN